MIPIAPALLLAAALAAAPPPGDCATTDLMPSFWSFWEKARGKDADAQYRLFDSMVVKPHAAVYDGIFREVPKPPKEFVPTSLAGVPALESSMRALSARLASELPEELAAFRKSFPRFLCTVPVYFLYSAGAFDGATRDVSGRESLMFGLDVIARLDEELAPLVVHELFHVYHGEIVPSPPETFAWALWEEGLASYVSRRLNPEIPEPKICCLPRIDPADVPKLSAEALRLLDSESREDYARFFLGGQAGDRPARSGYVLGYRIAQEAGESRTLEELAAIDPGEARAAAEATLLRLAASAGR